MEDQQLQKHSPMPSQTTFGIESDRFSGAGKSGGVGRGFRGIRWRTDADNAADSELENPDDIQDTGTRDVVDGGGDDTMGDKPEDERQVPMTLDVCGICGEDNPDAVVNGRCAACAS